MIAERILHIVESQDAIRGVVAALIDKMNGDAAAGTTAVFEDGICEGSDLLQGEGCLLGEEAWWVPSVSKQLYFLSEGL